MVKISTANKAKKILLKKKGYFDLSNLEKRNMIYAFTKKNKVVTMSGFDLVRTRKKINFLDEKDISKNISNITLIEIKGTDRELDSSFSRYFFGMTMSQIIIAQSLKKQYKFIFVNVNSKHILELSISQIFNKVKNLHMVLHIRI